MLIGASIVLLIVLVLVIRELTGGRADTVPATTRSPSSTPGAPEEEVEVTRVGRDPNTPGLARFEAEEDKDDADLGQSGQSALTTFEAGAVEGVEEPTGPVELILVSAVAQTDVGQKRKRNEDSYLVMPEHGVYVVADGMGGYAGGDVASRIAVNTIAEVMENASFSGNPDPKRPRRGNELVWAIEAANTAVHDA
ncbi:MAG: protein phosphatase 2C domain-containing protein, partial [Polyangiaceae bacterium]